jgi:hypothetical protein
MKIWKASISDRRNNIDDDIYALTKEELDSIGFNGVVTWVGQITGEQFLEECNWGYKKVRTAVEKELK